NTYRHQGAMQGQLNTTGCEYHCANPSTTQTTGSQDCDNTTCQFPPEVCNGLDDDCNFLVDDSPTDVGGPCGQNCPGQSVTNCVGECHAGTLACSAGLKVCQGSTGPTPEICDHKDNDCNGTTDDNLSDGWVGQACCPTGNLADCANTGGGTHCQAGAYQCQAGARVCSGGVTKAPETCDA